MTGGASELRLRTEISDFSRRVHARGWVANHDGNLSVRVDPGRILCTPTAVSKAEVTPEMVVALMFDEGGLRVASGQLKPPSEINLHRCVYQARPDVGAVLHAHPPTATGFAVAGVALLERPVLPEAVVSLGPTIPTVPFAPPGEAAATALAPVIRLHDAVLLAGHGVLTVGDSLEQAYLRMELCEHLARIALTAHHLGAAPAIPPEIMPALLEARRRAGLGPEARGEAPPPAPEPPSDLSRIVREEIERALRNPR